MAQADRLAESSIVPVYQAFGGGDYPDDANGHWVLPTAAQERQILADWAAVVPHPEFDYAYSWGSQKGDMALSQSPPCRPCSRKRTPGPARRTPGCSPRRAARR